MLTILSCSFDFYHSNFLKRMVTACLALLPSVKTGPFPNDVLRLDWASFKENFN
jgi:hypothetical protein